MTASFAFCHQLHVTNEYYKKNFLLLWQISDVLLIILTISASVKQQKKS